MSNAIVPAEATAPSPSEHMIRLSSDYVLSRSLQVVAELGIADLLATGPRTSGALAAETGAHAPSLYRLLRALSGFGVFVEHEDGTFRLTRLGATLRSDGAGSVRNWVLLNSSRSQSCAIPFRPANRASTGP